MFEIQDLVRVTGVSENVIRGWLADGSFPRPSREEPSQWDDLLCAIVSCGWRKERLPYPQNQATVLCIINQKGGVGKTMSATNIAACLAHRGLRTLLVDIDPQANAGENLGVVSDLHIHHVFLKGIDPFKVIRHKDFGQGIAFDVLPSGIELVRGKEDMHHHPLRVEFLGAVMEKLRDHYQLIVVDCPPDLGTLSLNALRAAHGFIIPLNAEINSLIGLADLLSTVSIIQAPRGELGLNHPLNWTGVLITDRSRTGIQNEFESEIRRLCAGKVFRTAIPHLTAFEQAKALKIPVLAHEPKGKAAGCYLDATDELLDRIAG